MLVDTNGLLLRVLVHMADISDTEGGVWMLANHRCALPRLKTIRVDQGYKEGLVTGHVSCQQPTVAQKTDASQLDDGQETRL